MIESSKITEIINTSPSVELLRLRNREAIIGFLMKTFSNLQGGISSDNIHSQLADYLEFKQIENNIYSLVLPFGLPLRWVSANQAHQVEFFRSMRGFLDSSGYLLIGFNNSWNFRSTTQAKYHASTPRRIAYQLHQAGFKAIKVCGVMPNLRVPEYIFDLNAQAIHFALHHRFRRKPALLKFLQRFSAILGWTRIPAFLPAYFAVATV